MNSILSGQMKILGRITDASNATLLAEIDGKKVVYKPIAGERPLWDFPTGNLAHREYAAYVVSRDLGLNLVPTTILREGTYGAGMVQEWCDSNPGIDVVEIAQSDNSEIRRMAIFDVIINNGDRKFGHILPVSKEEIFGCDHGVTFNVENKLRTVLWQWRGSAYSTDEMNIFHNASQLARTGILDQYITQPEIAAMIQRCEMQIQIGHFPQPSDEWPAVPWPPF